MIKINIERDSLRSTLRMLDKATPRFSRSDVNKLIATAGHANVMKHFSDERGPDGKWKSWSSEYAERMNAKGKGGNKILQDTGNLRQTVKPGHSDSEAYILADSEYAAAHNFGTSKLPKREFMFIDDDGFEKIENGILKILGV